MGKDEEDEMGDRTLGYTMTSEPHLYQNHARICLDTGGRNKQTNKQTISISCRSSEAEAGSPWSCLRRDTRRCAPQPSITPHLSPLVSLAWDNHQHRETPDGSDTALHELPARSEITHRGLPHRGKLHSHQALLICVI